MRKRYLAAVAAVAMFAAGCSSQAASSNGGESGSADNSQGVTATTIKIGTTLPLTGGAATSGAGFKAGLEAAVKEINDAGGINGRQLELTVLDDGFEAARSVANVRRLGDEEKVFSIVSPAGSANLPGSWPYIESKGLVVFGPVLPPDPGLKPVYLLGTSHTNQARVIMDFLASKGVKTVGVIGQDNDLGEAIMTGVQQQAGTDGITVVADEKTEPNSTDVSSAVLNLQKANPDAVVFGTDNTQSALVMKQAAQLNWHPIFIGDSSTVTTGSAGTVGAAGDAAKDLYGSMVVELPSATSNPAVQAFAAAVAKVDPSQASNGYALMAYGTTKIWAEIVKQMGDTLTWDNFSNVAEQLNGLETGLYPPVSFSAPPSGRTGTTGAKIAQWDGSAWNVLSENWLEPK